MLIKLQDFVVCSSVGIYSPLLKCYVIVDFYPLFRVVDLAAGVDFVYEGPYTLKVIAITDSPLNEPQWFTEEEIIRYNNMN